MSASSIIRRTLALVIGLAPAAAMAQQPAATKTVNVAVAANFTEAAREIAAAFKVRTGEDAILSFGSSGQFYTQITQDAPFGIMLSADDERPKKLIADGLGVAGSQFTYAVGKLVLWSAQAGFVKGEETLKSAAFSKLSLAAPDAAPYGAAGIETLKALGLYDKLKDRIVQGASIAQAFQFVQSGNAEVGFVALSQVIGDVGGSRWLVPQTLYSAIVQDAVLLKKAADNAAAKDFLAFLRGPEAKSIILKYGYDTSSGH